MVIIGKMENAIMRRPGLKTLLFPLFIVAAIVVGLALRFWIGPGSSIVDTYGIPVGLFSLILLSLVIYGHIETYRIGGYVHRYIILLFVFNFPPIKAPKCFYSDLLDLLRVNLSACFV